MKVLRALRENRKGTKATDTGRIRRYGLAKCQPIFCWFQQNFAASRKIA